MTLTELQIDGMASIKEDGRIAILNYRVKALPKSWILGQDFRKIQGYNQIRATLYNINRAITIDARILIRKMTLEVFINGQSSAVFNKYVNIYSALPVGEGSVVVTIKMPELIKSKEYSKTLN